MGYTVTRASNDRGIDIVAEKEQPYHQKVLIQTKRYSKGNKVGSKEVQQYYSLKDQEDNVDQVITVTTSSFTKSS
ncbi:MAG: restriction endonuclease [Candidatus Nanohaloarchaea archaeon]